MTETTTDDLISPDDKDWTWVLERPCPECGHDMSAVAADEIAPALRGAARDWADLLAVDDGSLRERPRPDRWSTLEYGAHVRDVFVRFGERATLMLENDDPLFDNWDQDETAREERYNEQDPRDVQAALLTAGDEVAALFGAVSGADWERPGRRSDGSAFTVLSLGRYLLHDPLHHLWDVSWARGVRAR